MADEQTQGADESQIEGSEEQTESFGDSSQGLTQEQVEHLLQDRDKKWQSKFDKLLQEKKETESKSKTAEERMAELEQRYEQERIGRVRERAISGAQLDADVVSAAEALLSSDDESVGNGAAKLRELIDAKAEAKAQEQLEAEIKKRFPEGKKPKTGKQGGEMTYEELMALSEDELQNIPREQRLAIMNKKQE